MRRGAGESALHVLAVNRRERELLALIRLAERHLPSKDARELYNSLCTGLFFKAPPMVP